VTSNKTTDVNKNNVPIIPYLPPAGKITVVKQNNIPIIP
jgi:hypothetical protein